MRRRPAGLLATLGNALVLCFFPPSLLLFGGSLGFGLQRSLGGGDLRQPLRLVGDPVRHLIAALVAVELVLLRIGRLRRLEPAVDLVLQFGLPLVHALVAHRLVLGRIRLDLGAVERDMPEPHQPGFLGELQHLHEQRAASAVRCRRRNSFEMVRKPGASPATIIMKSACSAAARAIRRDEQMPMA